MGWLASTSAKQKASCSSKRSERVGFSDFLLLLLLAGNACQAAKMERCAPTAICAVGAAMPTSRFFTCEAVAQ